jgi:hypothetical protein
MLLLCLNMTTATSPLRHGRANMHAVEVTIQNLISSGMDPKTENNPYLGFVYTSFQERATKVSQAEGLVWLMRGRAIALAAYDVALVHG